MNKEAFYNFLRPHVNLTTQNVFGMEKVLDYALAKRDSARKLPYRLATAWWETAQTMWPIKEAFWLSETWRAKNLRYYPYYGRGLIQLTWRDNYLKLAKLIDLPEEIFANNPNLVMNWEYALPALFLGMDEGLYTGKDLDDYIDDKDESDDEDFREFKNARRVVNGTDRASEIARLAIIFEHALRDASYEGSLPPSDKPLVLLRKGSVGEDVKRLQEVLRVNVDGIFGKKTDKALREWQAIHGLQVDGLAGPKTLTAMGLQ